MRLLLILLVLLLPLGCGTADQRAAEPASTATPDPRAEIDGTVTVLAAASLTETFRTLARRFEQRHPGAHVRLGFGGSSTLAQQIRSGAPADVFASAAPEPLRELRTDGDPVIFARNRLQIAVPAGNPGRVTTLADFADPDRTFAVCAREVPCGTAAHEAFRRAGVTARPDTFGRDVKAVLTAVRLGEVDAGLVYRTDVRAASGDVDGIDIPEAAQVATDYPIVRLAEAANPVGAQAFVDYVTSAEAADVLARAGFEIP